MMLGFILRMSVRYWGRTSLILWMFQTALPRHKKSATTRSWCSSFAGPMGLIGWRELSQGSFQILVLSPFPMALLRLVTRRSLPARILRHPWDAAFGGSTTRKDSLLQYLPLRTLESKQSGFEMIRQACFASKAVLKAWISLMPRPPNALGAKYSYIFFFGAMSMWINGVINVALWEHLFPTVKGRINYFTAHVYYHL